MASNSSTYLDPRFDVLKAKKPPSLGLWPLTPCPRCQTKQWIPRSYCFHCHATLGFSKRTFVEDGGICPGFHKKQGSLAELLANPPALNLALSERVHEVLTLLSHSSDEGPWSLFVDERAAFAAGSLEEVDSPAGSERHFHLRHPWLMLKSETQQIALIQGFHLDLIKSYKDRHVTIKQSHSPRWELLYKRQTTSSNVAGFVSLEKQTEAEILAELQSILSSESMSEPVQTPKHISFPATLARLPQLTEVYKQTRSAAAVLILLGLLSLIVLGPVRRHLEIYRLARSLSGGPKVKQVDRLIELGKEEPPSLEVALNGPDSWGKNNAIAALKGMKHPDTIAESLRLSKDLSPIARHQAMVALAELGARKELRDIVKKKGRLDTRQYAIRFLAELKDEYFAKDALELVSDKDLDPDIRVELLCALPTLIPKTDGETLSPIAKILGNDAEPAPVRHAAIFSHLNCGGDPDLIARTLSELVARIRNQPELIILERLTVRAAIHGLRGSAKIPHQQLLKSIEDEDWLDSDLLRILHRSMRPPSKF